MKVAQSKSFRDQTTNESFRFHDIFFDEIMLHSVA